MSIAFEIYRDGTKVTSYAPVGAHVVGPESVPIPGHVQFQDGQLVVDRVDGHAVGVALVWDAGEIGAYHLETTRLPPREKPYILNVELARCRLMKIIQKQEDWNLFEFPNVETITEDLREAQNIFAQALGKLDKPAEAATLADRALAMGIAVSEDLTTFHADLLLNRRRMNNAFVRHVAGCRINPLIQNQKYKDTAATEFDYVVVPMNWRQIQPEEDAFDTESVDHWIDFLARQRIPIIAGPVVGLTETSVPDWMFIWEHDFDTLRDLAQEFVQKMLQRYRRTVAAWNVMAGIPTNTAFTLTFEQMIELTRHLVQQIKTIMPSAKTLVTVSQPYGEYHSRTPTSVPPLLYAEMVSQAGIPFDAFALEMEMGAPAEGNFVRDLFQISGMLDKYSTLGKPVYLTAVGVPSRSTPDPNDASEGHLDPVTAGRWRSDWDPDRQAKWVDAVYRMAMSKPFIESISWAHLADMGHGLPGGGLLDDMLRPKPAFNQLQELRHQFHQWVSKR